MFTFPPFHFLSTNTFLLDSPISCPLLLPTSGSGAELLKAFKIVSLPKIAGSLQLGLVQCLCLHVQVAWGESMYKADHGQTTGQYNECLPNKVLKNQLCAR